MATKIITQKRPVPIFRDYQISFEADGYFTDWIFETFLKSESKLYNFEHDHLTNAEIGVLWASIENRRQGKQIVGQCELAAMVGGSQGKWQRERAQAQLYEWFGRELDFLLTFDTRFMSDTDDATFCAVVEHELLHCGQATDEFGLPKFKKDGSPKFAVRGHDLEEFVSVIRRYGTKASTQSYEIGELVRAAGSKPEIALADIGAACGTCLK